MSQKKMIGQRIKTMRLSRGMTQADLAKAIQQSQSSITMYETGRREPDFETMEALADVFNVPMASLVDDVSSSTSLSSFENSGNEDLSLLINGARHLSPEQIRQALDMMKIVFSQSAKYFEKESDK